MFLKHLFARRPQTVSFSPDLPGAERDSLRAEFSLCLERDGGRLATARRINGLASLFDGLTPAGRKVFADTVAALDTGAARETASRYTKIEEAEFFGRATSKLAILDAFERPRRRLLLMFRDARGGDAVIATLRDIWVDEESDDLVEDIDTLADA